MPTPRRLRLTVRYLRAVARLGVKGGSERSVALTRTIHTLLAASTLPTAADARARIGSNASAHVRRVQGRNLWLWYNATDEEVSLVGLTTDPPVPEWARSCGGTQEPLGH